MAHTVREQVAEARRLSAEHDLGIGLIDCQESVQIANERFDGDILMGIF